MLRVHGSGSRVKTSPPGVMTDQPINPTWIEEGQPRARGAVVIQSEDGTLFSGQWDCTAGRFSWTYNEDEVIHILEGEAFIEVDGAMRAISPGDTIFFPLGQTVRWHVPKYVRKVFFIRHPSKVVEALRTVKVLGAFLLTQVPEALSLDSVLLSLA